MNTHPAHQPYRAANGAPQTEFVDFHPLHSGKGRSTETVAASTISDAGFFGTFKSDAF